MKSIRMSFLASALFAVAVSSGCGSRNPTEAQSPAPAPAPQHCPVVKVTCDAAAQEGTELRFDAGLSGGDAGVEPTFNWTVSAGTIYSGQGSPSIAVATFVGMGGSTVTASVDAGGYASECQTSASCSVAVN